MTAEKLIKRLSLSPLSGEGGFFRRVHLDDTTVETAVLGQFARARLPLSSAIYYLLTPQSFSSLHRLSGTEIWTWIAGDELEQVLLAVDHTLSVRRLGLGDAAEPLSVVPRLWWQGTKIAEPVRHGYCLCTTVMAPAFDERDFVLATPELLEQLDTKSAEMLRAYLPAKKEKA